MCLGIPAQIVEFVDADAGIAKAEISGVRRNVSVALCPEAQVDDWVLVHVGSRIDEEQARETIALLEQMGEAYEQEVREIRESAGA